jgi:hypothetical protein
MENNNYFERFESYLKTFSQVYWLRPMTAIWRALEAAYFDFELIQKENLDADWVDLGVGDAIFSTVATGLPIPRNFDAYKWLKESQDTKLDLDGRLDNFDTPPKVNVFDLNKFPSLISRRNTPKSPWALGIDHKANLLLKAEKLSSFRNLRLATLNKPEKLFEKKESFDLCFSNSLYWSDSPSLVLKNIRKHVNASKGTNLVLSLQLPNFIKYREENFDNFGSLVHFFDKDRKEHYKSVYGVEEWSEIIESYNFKITDWLFFANKHLVNSIEWLDNRELYPYFASLREKVKVRDQVKVKLEVSDYIQKLGIRAFKTGVFQADEGSASYFLVKAEAI